jgi:hypothetical protein
VLHSLASATARKTRSPSPMTHRRPLCTWQDITSAITPPCQLLPRRSFLPAFASKPLLVYKASRRLPLAAPVFPSPARLGQHPKPKPHLPKNPFEPSRSPPSRCNAAGELPSPETLEIPLLSATGVYMLAPPHAGARRRRGYPGDPPCEAASPPVPGVARTKQPPPGKP